MRPDWRILKKIIILGSASFFMSASEGVLHVCFNRQVYAHGGDLAVGAMTILFSMFQFVLLPVEGVAQGSQPIIGYNYGSGAYHRVWATIKLALTANSIFMVIVTTIVVLFPQIFIRIFNSDWSLVGLSGRMLRIYISGGSSRKSFRRRQTAGTRCRKTCGCPLARRRAVRHSA